MTKKKNKKPSNLVSPHGSDRYYYPYRYTPPELNGTKYLDISAEFSGQDQMFAHFDPQGSWTGISDDGSPPVQDADDL